MFRQRTKQKKGGFVYCIRASEFCKIGVTTNLHQRLERLVPQCPFMLACVHFIHTDDMYAVENYWHRRFSEKRTTGEWFRLTKFDLAAFMKHKHATISRAGQYVALDQTVLSGLRDGDDQPRKVNFKTMPQAQPPVKRNPIPAGDHILMLVSVVSEMQPSYNNPDVLTERWTWQFKSNKRDEETGDRYEYRTWTGPTYGNEKAAYTILVDMMFPDLSEVEKSTLDTDPYTGKKWKAKIKHAKNAKGDMVPKLAYIEPYTKAEEAPSPTKPVAKPADEDEEESDPFADE
jgi:hypothetical protein